MSEEIERSLLMSYLGAQRDHVLGILDGLDDADLRRGVLPSGWSCAGAVQHLTLDVEQFWFAAVVAGDAPVIAGLDAIDDAWQVSNDISATTVLDRYRDAIAQADAIIASTPLDAAPAWWPADQFGDWRMDSLRQIVVHVMVETACHAGHLDAAREIIDQRQWFVID